MLKYTNKRFVQVQDWDKLVIDTYGKPYSFQQQDGCQSRGIYSVDIPDNSWDWDDEDEMNDFIPEKINGEEMGVKFKVWLNTDPEEQKQRNGWDDFRINLFWERNFYPNIQTVANDLYKKGLIEAGNYIINIDW